MGSCLSAPGTDQRQAGGEANNAQTTSSRRQERAGRERTSLERRNTEARDQLLAGRGEAPKYRQHPAWIANPPITRSDLEHSRKAFWETADTFGGRSEVWQTLRAAIDCDNVDTAQVYLDEAQLRLLGNGDLINGCYDQTGFFYKIPQNCLSDPSNLLADDQAASTFESKPTNVIEDFPSGELVDLKDLIVRVAMLEKISSVATKIQTASGVSKLKLMILGKMLKDDGIQTLRDVGWSPGLIVQGLVTQP